MKAALGRMLGILADEESLPPIDVGADLERLKAAFPCARPCERRPRGDDVWNAAGPEAVLSQVMETCQARGTAPYAGPLPQSPTPCRRALGRRSSSGTRPRPERNRAGGHACRGRRELPHDVERSQAASDIGQKRPRCAPRKSTPMSGTESPTSLTRDKPLQPGKAARRRHRAVLAGPTAQRQSPVRPVRVRLPVPLRVHIPGV